ncbi:MAG TPA: redoxin domain-containing protein, partial [Chitinivibrionales bacterium]|nr:redoxin domain-containing protein [Chitinivibrionales bacterium]
MADRLPGSVIQSFPNLFTAWALVVVFAAGTTANVGAAMLDIGKTAPDFTLVSDKGDTVRLSDFRGNNYVVLIFYPGDQTPGCTKQLCAIRDDYAEFGKKGAVVFGVNPADAESHAQF